VDAKVTGGIGAGRSIVLDAKGAITLKAGLKTGGDVTLTARNAGIEARSATNRKTEMRSLTRATR
jgi:DNA repair ATPase RecN